MNIRSAKLIPAPKVAALALAAGLLMLGAPSANAQWFRFGFDSSVPAMEVERLLQESGYRLTAPIYRNGEVYVASVLGRDEVPERLIIDAHDGRLLQRYAAPRRARDIAGDWSAPRPHLPARDAWVDNGDDWGAPRPPAPIYGDDNGRPAPRPDDVARTDDPPNSSPYVILAPPAATHEPTLEKPRAKPQVRHKKPEPAPVAQPGAPTTSPAQTPAPTDAKLTPTAPPAATPESTAPARPETAGEPAPAPRMADTKAAAPEVAPVAAPAPAAAPPQKSKPAPNDVPVAPLE